MSPGEDLRNAIEQFVIGQHIEAGWIATCEGSLLAAHLRFANQRQGSILTGPFEILSLGGTVSSNGCHLHIAIADGNGITSGGHLLEGCLVFTAHEIVINSIEEYVFSRHADPETVFRELKGRLAIDNK